MKQLLLFFIALLIPFCSNAQETVEARGTLLYYTKDKILHIKIHSGHLPKKGQKVEVEKAFKLGKMDGRYSIMEGVVIGGTNKDLQVQAERYSSTVVRDGEDHPLCEKGDEMVLEWAADEEDIARAHFDEDLIKAKTAYLHYEFDKAVTMLNKLIALDDHCIDCYYVRGRCHMDLYQEAEAIKDFTKTIELHPESIHGIEKAYEFRAQAYFNLGEDEKAIADYDKLLTLDLKANEITYYLKRKLEIYSDEEVSHKYDHKEAYEHACDCVKKLQAIEGQTIENQGFNNKHCGKIHPPEKLTARTDFEVLSQSEGGHSLTVNAKNAALNCYDFEKLTYNAKIKKGTCITMYTCSEGSSISTAVAKVESIKGDKITLKILYWSNTLNGDFIVHDYKAGDIFMAKW